MITPHLFPSITLPISKIQQKCGYRDVFYHYFSFYDNHTSKPSVTPAYCAVSFFTYIKFIDHLTDLIEFHKIYPFSCNAFFIGLKAAKK